MDNKELLEKIDKALDLRVRPAIKTHSGNVEVVSFESESGVLTVRFAGTCVGCPMSALTLKAGVESEILEKFPEVNEVVAEGVDEDEMLGVDGEE
ncbi:MAG: hypothetical protein HW383_447 [Candidatus Magasanikbacteria bacterium]|nr:hypothetical protein [Candidatus Magasanikbacteria bacterium]